MCLSKLTEVLLWSFWFQIHENLALPYRTPEFKVKMREKGNVQEFGRIDMAVVVQSNNAYIHKHVYKHVNVAMLTCARVRSSSSSPKYTIKYTNVISQVNGPYILDEIVKLSKISGKHKATRREKWKRRRKFTLNIG